MVTTREFSRIHPLESQIGFRLIRGEMTIGPCQTRLKRNSDTTNSDSPGFMRCGLPDVESQTEWRVLTPKSLGN